MPAAARPDAEILVHHRRLELARRRACALATPTLEESMAIGFPQISPGQRAVCRLIQGLPPRDDAEADLYAVLLGRAWGDDLATPKTLVLVLAGRGSGKSYIAAAYANWRALTCPTTVGPGERAHVILMAPTQRLAGQVMAYAAGMLRGARGSDEAVEHIGAETVRFLRPTEISVYAASSGGMGVRAKSLAGVVLDEAAFFRHEMGNAVTDRAIVDAATYRLMDGAQILLPSSPWARGGLCYELFEREFGRSEHALVLRAPTEILNAAAPALRLLAAAVTEHERSARRRELGAEFVEDDDLGIAGDAEIAACMLAFELTPADGLGDWEDALDLAGSGDDRTAYAIGRNDGYDGADVALIRSWDRRTPMEQRFAEIATLRRAYGIRGRVACDQFSFDAAEALGRFCDVPLWRMSALDAASYAAFGAMVREQRVRLPPERKLRSQLPLLALQAKSGGTLSVVVPRDPDGGHCDEAVVTVRLCTAIRSRRYVRAIGSRGAVPRAKPRPVADADETWGALGHAALDGPLR